MIVGTGCLGRDATNGSRIRELLEAVRIRRPLLVLGAERDGAPAAQDLRGLRAAGVRAPWARRDEACRIAAYSGADQVILEPPRLASMDALCRELFALVGGHPGLALALATPAEGTLAAPDRLELVLDDLPGRPVAYWHRPAHAHLLGQRDVGWLDTLGRRLVGVSLDDVVERQTGLPPGVGEVDFAPLAGLIGRSVPCVLDLGPIEEVELVRLALRTLEELGFA